MRTTVTLDSDTEHLVRERMRQHDISFKQALNDAIRASAPATAPAFSTPVLDMGVPTMDLTKALRVAGELEDEGLIASMRRGA